ncbi:chromosome segregation protein SMC [Streptococcus sp. sy004]|uniref:chromosome segregation protein SMC n=1 Tax=Streptococcus sp. sy004 TaxID=2600149 RepID=UPI0011B641F8|nr:chromosome segregation protein SMC [Streptococcus sp. sy004]TWT12261.1 chromosome segregation protein SMC [Streptococcus sp. sy004]
MFLKAIEMQGFKSFADKTKIEFDQGVTAIVGPNGSGKSNITESLRWALGESSAKSLRGGKMLDVIFAGTENRHALNYAQVAVILDNQDGFIADAGQEIRIERQLYRNGDSDYLIDGKKVRLRDIHDLFMDTGLGRDSFSIISQGRVEAIFNSKPEERRAIFEEAAGVLKYKTRKKETEQKLNQTQDNLDRLDDIIYELDLQVKPLGKQAEVAKAFLDLDEKRKQVQLDLLVADVSTYKQDLTHTQNELEKVQNQLAVYYQEREELEADYSTKKDKRQSLSRKQDQLQDNLVELTRLTSHLEGQLDLAQLEQSQQTIQKEQLQEQTDKLTKQQGQLQEQIDDKQALITKLKQNLTIKQAELHKLVNQQEQYAISPDQLIENLREEFVGLLEKEADLSNDLTALQAERASQTQISQQKSAELDKLSQELKEVEIAKTNAQTKLTKQEHHLTELRNRYQVLTQELNQKKACYEKEQTSFFALLDQLKAKEARQSSLVSILKNHSNFYAGVKYVLQQADRLGGIIGAVSEHVSFELTYQTAIEVALGASSQHIIVADEQAAKRSIEALKTSRQGRATFLPLTTIKGRKPAPQHEQTLRQSPGFLGFANDLVTYESNLANIFANLLGATAIFETIDQANQAARLTHYQVRLVTLDGTELRTGGSFAGGAQRQNNMTFIKPELEQLDQKIKQQKEELVLKEEQLKQAKENLSTLTEELQLIKEEGEQARLGHQKAQLELEQLIKRHQELTQIVGDVDAITNQDYLVSLGERESLLKTDLSELAESKQALSRQLEQIKENRNHVQKQLDDLTDQVAAARLAERDLLNTLRFEQEDYKRLLADLEKVTTELLKLQGQLSGKTQKLNPEKLEQLRTDLDQACHRKEETEQAIIRLKLNLEDCEASLEEVAVQLTKINQQHEGLIRQQTQLELTIEHYSDKLRQLAKSLAEDYQISFEEAQKISQPLDNVVEARQILADLIRQIKQLGSINLEAIQQFEEISQRLAFLSEQKADLMEAKTLLTDTIKEMNDEVKERFRERFEAIRHSFHQTFKQMFGGGRSDLLLTEDDLLTAGIEISVQPPGKKIQSLNLMSGGEKALTALALLFAIIRVKTIPFVILDEVEAALDEANVKRFGDYLNRFDKSSQFIVVTHRKGTMAAADSIYGVTMQESGVSKLVSVKLTEAETMMSK